MLFVKVDFHYITSVEKCCLEKEWSFAVHGSSSSFRSTLKNEAPLARSSVLLTNLITLLLGRGCKLVSQVLRNGMELALYHPW